MLEAIFINNEIIVKALSKNHHFFQSIISINLNIEVFIYDVL